MVFAQMFARVYYIARTKVYLGGTTLTQGFVMIRIRLINVSQVPGENPGRQEKSMQTH